jgi:hypothetical protein
MHFIESYACLPAVNQENRITMRKEKRNIERNLLYSVSWYGTAVFTLSIKRCRWYTNECRWSKPISQYCAGLYFSVVTTFLTK